MTRANGSFDFLRSECVVGMAFRVERTYFGGQFASGDGVTLDCDKKSASIFYMQGTHLHLEAR
jgi:hypothetical protein